MMEWNLLSPSRLSLCVFPVTSSQNEWDIIIYCMMCQPRPNFRNDPIYYVIWLAYFSSFPRVQWTNHWPPRRWERLSVRAARGNKGKKEMGPVHRWAMQLPNWRIPIITGLQILGIRCLSLVTTCYNPFNEPLTWLAIAQVDGMVIRCFTSALWLRPSGRTCL